MKRILIKYYKLYANKFENWNGNISWKMTNYQSSMNKEQITWIALKLLSWIYSSKPFHKENSSPDVFNSEFYRTFQKEILLVFQNSSRRLKRRKYLLSGGSIILGIQTRRKTVQENATPVSLVKSEVKILNTSLANWIQQYTKRTIYKDQDGFMNASLG